MRASIVLSLLLASAAYAEPSAERVQRECGFPMAVRIDPAVTAANAKDNIGTQGEVDDIFGSIATACASTAGFKARAAGKLTSLHLVEIKQPRPEPNGDLWMTLALRNGELVAGVFPGVVNMALSVDSRIAELVAPGIKTDEDKKRIEACFAGKTEPCLAKGEGPFNGYTNAVTACGTVPKVEIDAALIEDYNRTDTGVAGSVDDIMSALPAACVSPAAKAKFARIHRLHVVWMPKSDASEPTFHVAKDELEVGISPRASNFHVAAEKWLMKNF